jgi:hypothetical protein
MSKADSSWSMLLVGSLVLLAVSTTGAVYGAEGGWCNTIVAYNRSSNQAMIPRHLHEPSKDRWGGCASNGCPTACKIVNETIGGVTYALCICNDASPLIGACLGATIEDPPAQPGQLPFTCVNTDGCVEPTPICDKKQITGPAGDTNEYWTCYCRGEEDD